MKWFDQKLLQIKYTMYVHKGGISFVVFIKGLFIENTVVICFRTYGVS